MAGSRDLEFQWGIWTLFALENWILDFGRPIAMVRQKFLIYSKSF